MDKTPYYINEAVRRELGDTRNSYYQAYAGTDIQAAIYLPLLTKGSALGKDTPKFKLFAELQTISISSTRSVSPVRVLGQSSPIDYTRGARTFAGTIVFATLNKDVFSEIHDVGLAESMMNSSTSLTADQMPPFSVVITASNEAGGAAMQVIHGITLINYGTTYSIDDMYTETQYTYVATDCSPLMPTSTSAYRSMKGMQDAQVAVKTLTTILGDSMQKAYTSYQSLFDKMKAKKNDTAANDGLDTAVVTPGLKRGQI